LKYLEKELLKRKQLGKTATVAGISLSLASTFSACNAPQQEAIIPISEQEIIAEIPEIEIIPDTPKIKEQMFPVGGIEAEIEYFNGEVNPDYFDIPIPIEDDVEVVNEEE
jgi:hypothetical protein